MTEKEKKSIIKIIILAVIQSAIIIGILGCVEIEGFSLIVCWGVKTGAIFFLIVTSFFLIKEIIKLFS
ncbi:MAG: hypothetical protein PVH67_02220 [Desulfobacterales bacterium]|jgi:hypothetical protein